MVDPHSYDLLVLLDPEAPEERRAELVEQIKGQIDSGEATLKGDADWGMRKLSYEIDHRREAQYHLFQFQAAPPVLAQLDRTLSIEDAVLRHRIIRLPGDAPETTPKPGEDTSRRPSEERVGSREDERPAADAADIPEAEASAEAVEEAPEAPAPVPPPAGEAPEAPPAVPPPTDEAVPTDAAPTDEGT
jgi:small subunit ribosomal protein S6